MLAKTGGMVATEPATEWRPTHRRLIAKALSWRVVGSLDTFILSLAMLSFIAPLLGLSGGHHHARTAGYIAATEFLTKTVLYYCHERVWGRFDWNVRQRPRGVDEGLGRNGLKAVTWRAVGFVDTVILSLVFTGSAAIAVAIGGSEVFTKVLLYIVHERIWARLPFGLVRAAPRSS